MVKPYRGRIAYPSYVDESLFGNPHEAAVRRARSMPSAVKEATVIGASELSRADTGPMTVAVFKVWLCQSPLRRMKNVSPHLIRRHPFVTSP